MNRYTNLFETAAVVGGRFDHPAQQHCDPAEEVSTEYSINLVERGGFSIQVGRFTWDLRSGDLFLNYPGLAYRCRHREAIPTDVCATVAFLQADEVAELAKLKRVAAKRAVLPSTNRIAYLFRKLSTVFNPPAGATAVGRIETENCLAVEESCAALLAEVCGEPGADGKLYRQHQLAWYAERVDAACRQLEKQYAVEHSLTLLARSVGMSTFHFARVFGELAGVPPHRYLLRVRMNHAQRSLRSGATVTQTCFSSGFHNLSHFIRSFQRWFGVSPAQYARQPSSQLPKHR